MHWLPALLLLLAQVASASAAKPKPVEVVLYGEAMCPYCKAFVDTFGKRVHDSGIADSGIVSFRYVAWGNARTQAVSWQHRLRPRSARVALTLPLARAGWSALPAWPEGVPGEPPAWA